MGKSYMSYNWEDYSDNYEWDDQPIQGDNNLRMSKRSSLEKSIRLENSRSPKGSASRYEMNGRHSRRRSEISDISRKVVNLQKISSGKEIVKINVTEINEKPIKEEMVILSNSISNNNEVILKRKSSKSVVMSRKDSLSIKDNLNEDLNTKLEDVSTTKNEAKSSKKDLNYLKVNNTEHEVVIESEREHEKSKDEMNSNRSLNKIIEVNEYKANNNTDSITTESTHSRGRVTYRNNNYTNYPNYKHSKDYYGYYNYNRNNNYNRNTRFNKDNTNRYYNTNTNSNNDDYRYRDTRSTFKFVEVPSVPVIPLNDQSVSNLEEKVQTEKLESKVKEESEQNVKVTESNEIFIDEKDKLKEDKNILSIKQPTRTETPYQEKVKLTKELESLSLSPMTKYKVVDNDDSVARDLILNLKEIKSQKEDKSNEKEKIKQEPLMAIDIENKLNKESKRDKTLEHPLIKKGWRVKKTNDIGEFPRGMDVACVYGNMVI